MKPLLSLIGLLLAGAIALTAQPASIRGRVTDPSGKSIPDAIVSMSNGRGAARSVKSDVQGQYQGANEFTEGARYPLAIMLHPGIGVHQFYCLIARRSAEEFSPARTVTVLALLTRPSSSHMVAYHGVGLSPAIASA